MILKKKIVGDKKIIKTSVDVLAVLYIEYFSLD